MKRYKDKEFLLEQYCDLGKTTVQIAEEINCGRNTLVRWMDKFNISRRPARILLKHSGDREWINRQYVELGKSISQIAKETGYADKTIWNWLVRYDIPRRSCKRRGNHLDISERFLTYLDGTLLGDGGIYAISDVAANYEIGQKFLSYIRYVGDILSGHGLSRSGAIQKRRIKHKTGNTTKAYFYRTLSYRELYKQRERWYPNGIKRVPKDVRLTPLSLRTWFLEDGCLSRSKKWNFNEVILCTNAFTDNGREMLADKLKMILDTSQIHINKQGVLRFGRHEAIERFFNFILPLPKELKIDYGYKYL